MIFLLETLTPQYYCWCIDNYTCTGCHNKLKPTRTCISSVREIIYILVCNSLLTSDLTLRLDGAHCVVYSLCDIQFINSRAVLFMPPSYDVGKPTSVSTGADILTYLWLADRSNHVNVVRESPENPYFPVCVHIAI